MVDLDADLAAIFEGDDLDQVDAVITTSGGAITARGFFTGPTDAVTINETRVEAAEPTFMCQTADITSVRRGDAMSVADDVYSVQRIQKCGDGMSVCYLKT
jgi:hypothetical protein